MSEQRARFFDPTVYRSIGSLEQAKPSFSPLSESVFRSVGIDLKLAPVSLSPKDSLPKASKEVQLFPSSSVLPSLPELRRKEIIGKEIVSSDQLIIEEPIDAPDERFLEPNSTFFTTKSPQVMLTSISQYLQGKKIPHQLSGNHKIKGILQEEIESGDTCKFRIQIFKTAEKSEKSSEQLRAKYLVEVQRRCGCALTFRTFYTQLMSALKTERLVDSNLSLR